MLFQTQESRCKYRLIPGCLCFHDRKGSLEGICNGYNYVENLKFLVGLVSFVYFCSLMQLLKTLMADPSFFPNLRLSKKTQGIGAL